MDNKIHNNLNKNKQDLILVLLKIIINHKNKNYNHSILILIQLKMIIINKNRKNQNKVRISSWVSFKIRIKKKINKMMIYLNNLSNKIMKRLNLKNYYNLLNK